MYVNLDFQAYKYYKKLMNGAATPGRAVQLSHRPGLAA